MTVLWSFDREPPSETERVAKLRISLNHLEVSELEAAAVVVVDEDDHTVKEGPRFEDKWDAMFG